MLMGHPPPIIARGRAKASQGRFAGLTPGHGAIVGQALVAGDSEVEKALAETLEAVQKMASAGPHAFHRVAGPTGTVWGATRLRAGAMVDGPMGIGGLGKRVDGVGVGEAWRPAFPLGGHEGCARRGAPMLSH